MSKLLGSLDRGLVFVVSAPAGTGKTTLVRMLRAEFDCVAPSISYTTRKMRPKEMEGQDYHFIAKKEFDQKIARQEFLEYAQVFGDLDACAAWAKRNGGDANKIAVAGFGWGGRHAWLYAAHNAEIKTGLAWYGRLVTDSTSAAINPQNPINIAPTLVAPILGFYAGKDSAIPATTVTQMKDALALGSSHSEIVMYPKSGSGFYADYRLTYAPDDAKDSWKRAIDWLHSHGLE